jgi:hypothetical protein
MTIKLVHNNGSTITMEQKKPGYKVKIAVHYSSCFKDDVLWTDKDSANRFYNNRIKDGFTRA